MSLAARFQLAHPGFTLDVDLALPGSGVTALFGPSGSGKTSCLRCVAGLETAARGSLVVAGETWQDSERGLFLPPHRRALGYVFQDANLFEHLDVRRNLLFGWRRVAPGDRRLALEQIVELLGIEGLLSRMPARLSGGERQRVGIARALLTSPRLLLMDEPLAALDAERKAEILPYLERLTRELALPILYVSHAPDEVARLADHLVLLERGRVLASGPTTEVLARLDLSIALAEDAGVVLEGRVLGHDPDYGLLSLGLPGEQRVLLAHAPLPSGQALRIKVLARDVSLSLERQHSSILNVLPATVAEIAPTRSPAQVLLRLDLGGTALLARITRYSLERLTLQPGSRVWAQLKSVAVLA
ncbi:MULTISPECIES: molybdenum ABC transporter ATP-binding protein [Pseudomonas]|uniref:Molybdenum ABC transporter ATP-binding protein n=1 Tax=Pseudomonas benzopyrenica TaxID=2993566 RepID=A0ABZ2FUU7_9PSED|nr:MULTISPECIES: molybdenum ABC transporter ATP-binding protein [Pseudomonas]MXS21012.1 molybdenum ABC transporter ATP-binding protein [Pseudomonas oryzihabitans]UUW70160.1 molybdenum ABC transporter ATP-binding protein [Pseudomonas psychrotolerans]